MAELGFIDEEKLLSVEGTSVSFEDTGFSFESVFAVFNMALKKYAALDESAFLELLNSLPEKPKKDNDEFLDMKFEDLLKTPVDVSRKINQIAQQDTNNRIEYSRRLLEQDALDFENVFEKDLPKMRIFTISMNDLTPYPSQGILAPPPVQPNEDLPTTPKIVVDSEFTGGINKEIRLNDPFHATVLSGNVVEQGAKGGIWFNAYFAQPVRPGSSEVRLSDRVILTTPEGNTLTFYTVGTQEHWFGDFEYHLLQAVPHKLHTPGLDVVIEDGHKIFTDHFLYSLTNHAGVNVGIIDIEIIDDVPVATNQAASITLTEADILTVGSNESNKTLVLTGDLLSDPTIAKNRLGPDGGTIFDIYLPDNAGTVVATTTILILTTPQGNELAVNRLTGSYVYTLNNPFDNSNDLNTTTMQAQDIFTYVLLDNDGDSASATLTITILDDKPIATDKLNEADETALFVNLSESVTGNLLTDDDGFGISKLGADGATITSINGISAVNGVITAGTTYGSITVYTLAHSENQIGDYIYSLDSAKTVLANDALLQVTDSISYTLTDADTPSTSSAQLLITISLNQAPSANDDSGTTDEHSVLTVNAINGVLANDTDPNDGDTKAVGEVNGFGLDVGNNIVLPSGAKIQLNSDGSYSYDPNGAFEYLAANASTTDNIIYSMHDAEGLTSQATLTITITGVNDPPELSGINNPTFVETGVLGTPVVADSAITITDIDSVNISGATIKITNALLGDVLSFSATLPGAIAISGNNTDSITLSNNGTLAEYESVLKAIMFDTDSTETANRSIDWAVTDDALATSAIFTTAIVITPDMSGKNGIHLSSAKRGADVLSIQDVLSDSETRTFTTEEANQMCINASEIHLDPIVVNSLPCLEEQFHII